ncbi:MAG: MBL fold metallo-hydrolase [Halobacteriovoraceae bacterium]|nr:MBL fold metallo-hydrolase [Halobacteriovoraceae bacterium]MCB9094036.1 MBL fold metallo-hydrolase [Halobacteriovoraceae bacterium]
MSNRSYHSIYPSFFKLDGGAMFGIIPKPLWERRIPADELNRIEMNCRIFYIQSGDKHILIDTGVGDYHDAKFQDRFGLDAIAHPVGESLHSFCEITPDAITDVVLTHLHFDHVGGLGTKDGKTPLYPNATVHIHKKHYEYALRSTPRDSGSFQKHYFQPLIELLDGRGKVRWLDEEKTGSLLEGADGYKLQYRTCFGHTPYQVLPYDDKIIYMGDTVPTAHHIDIPWVMGYDIQPGVSSVERKELYQFVMDNNLIMVFDHDKEHWGGKIAVDEKKRYIFTELYPCQSNQFESHQL